MRALALCLALAACGGGEAVREAPPPELMGVAAPAAVEAPAASPVAALAARATLRPSWRICNLSEVSPVWVAVALFRGLDGRTEGWWRLDRGACATVAPDLGGRAPAYYAVGVGRQWAGTALRCVDPARPFRQDGDICPAEAGLARVPFRTVEPGPGSLVTNLR